MNKLAISDQTKDRCIFAAVLVIVTASYIPSLNKHLNSDDYYLLWPGITDNPFLCFVEDRIPPGQVEPGFLRPIPILTFAIDARLRESIPFIYNYHTLLWHLVNVSLIGVFVTLPFRLNGSKRGIWPASLAMLFFGLHPQNTGAVSWISPRFDLMCSAFGMAGLYIWIASEKWRHVSVWKTATIACLVISLLCKEAGLIYFAGIAMWELWRTVRYYRTVDVRKQLFLLCSIAVMLALYFVYRLSVLKGMGGYQTFYLFQFSFSTIAAWCLVMLWPLVTLMPMELHGFDLAIAAAMALIVLGVPRASVSDDKMRCPWGLLILVCASWLFLMGWHIMLFQPILEHVCSRYTYIPLTAVAVMLGWGIQKLWHMRAARLLLRLAFVVILALFIVAQQQEIAKWKEAGRIANSIIGQTVELLPHPRDNAVMLFPDVPAYVRPTYYILDIGFPEALKYRYKREDINVIVWPDDAVVANPPPNSYLFRFDLNTFRMRLVQDHE
jgi:hypothetical protein